MGGLGAGSGRQVTRTGSAPGEGTVLDESFNAATLHLLRARVAACAAGVGMPEGRVADMMLAVHELAANAVRHGPGAGRLVIHAVRGALRCQVSDTGSGPCSWPVRHGHGLWIVRKVADQVNTSSGPEGTTVTAVFAV